MTADGGRSKKHLGGRWSCTVLQLGRKLSLTEYSLNPCDVICNVTQSNECEHKVGQHDSSVWQQYLMYLSPDYITYVAKWTISVSPTHRLMMGEVRRLIWPHLTFMKHLRYTKCEYLGLITFWKFRLPEKDCLSLTALQGCIVWPCGGLTYDDIGQWPNLTWKWKTNCCLAWMRDKLCQMSALYHKQLRSNPEKPIWGHPSAGKG